MAQRAQDRIIWSLNTAHPVSWGLSVPYPHTLGETVGWFRTYGRCLICRFLDDLCRSAHGPDNCYRSASAERPVKAGQAALTLGRRLCAQRVGDSCTYVRSLVPEPPWATSPTGQFCQPTSISGIASDGSFETDGFWQYQLESENTFANFWRIVQRESTPPSTDDAGTGAEHRCLAPAAVPRRRR